MLRHYLPRGLALLCAALLAGCAAGAPTAVTAPAAAPAAAASAPLPAFKHIFLIVMENKRYDQVIGDAGSPYINALAQRYGLATSSFAISHPSLPNYLALTGGDTFGVVSDCTSCTVAQSNIVDQLEAAGKSWKAYMESMPRPCFVGDSQLYRQKHNPFIYYDDIRGSPARCGKIVPLTELSADLQSGALPDFVWVTPNMCNDEHDCPPSAGDSWLSTWVPQIMATSAWRDGGLLLITYDEADSRDSSGCCQHAHGGHVATLVVSPLGRPGYRSTIAYDHYSLLRTIEDSWGLPELRGAACPCTPTLSDFFVPAS